LALREAEILINKTIKKVKKDELIDDLFDINAAKGMINIPSL